jgi:hypothetical protein
MCEQVVRTTRKIRNFYFRPVYKRNKNGGLALWQNLPVLEDILVIRWPGTIECVVWNYSADSPFVTIEPPAELRARLRGNGAPLVLRAADWERLQIEQVDQAEAREAA